MDISSASYTFMRETRRRRRRHHHRSRDSCSLKRPTKPICSRRRRQNDSNWKISPGQLCVCECNSFCAGIFPSIPYLFELLTRFGWACVCACIYAFRLNRIQLMGMHIAHCISGMKMCLRVFIVIREECAACILQRPILLLLLSKWW